MQGNINKILISALLMLAATAQSHPNDEYINTNGQTHLDSLRVTNELSQFRTPVRASSSHYTLGETYYFANNSSNLSTKSKSKLNAIADKAKNEGTVNIHVNGYTDSRSSFKYNKKLSIKRAYAVKHYLVEQGVSPSAIRISGLSEKHPVASNKTSKGRAANRRATLHINETKTVEGTGYIIGVVSN